MTNDLKNFLEEENDIIPQLLIYDKLSGSRFIDYKKFNERDTRLINFVLDLVEKEVEKEKNKKYKCEIHNKPMGLTANYYDCTDIHIGRAEALSDISTIIKSFRM